MPLPASLYNRRLKKTTFITTNQCAIIAMFVLAAIMLSTTGANATIHEIQVANFSFSPLNTVVTQGDTVRWILENRSALGKV